MKNANDYSVKVGIKLDDSSIANVKKDLESKLSTEGINIKFNTQGLEDLNTKIASVGSKLDKVSSKDGFKKTDSGAKTASKSVNTLNNNLEKTTKHLKNQTFATDSWAYNWSKAMQSFLTYTTVTQFFNTVQNGIKDMINQVKELDDSLIELQKVTDLEGASLERFIDKAYTAGEAVAKTGREMIEAATAFAKSGYDADMALQLGEVAAMYTNIADEEISTAKAADFIIAQMKAFNYEAGSATETLENAYHVIDAVNEVSNNFAVSSADIANNLGKASSVMANAGNSLEQMIGLMTAGTEVTRNASKVANGLKTLTLRLQGMNDEGERDLELQAQMEGLFKKLGISVYDANGQLKNTYDILATLAEVYPSLTNAEKAYVTETIAGKYQAQNAAAILTNWKTAVEATSTALNSNGSAAEENAKVLNSIQGHIQALNAEWEKLSKNTFSQEFIKGIIDVGTNLIKFANSGFGSWIIKAALLSTGIKLLMTIMSKLGKTIKDTVSYGSQLSKNWALLTGGASSLGKVLYQTEADYRGLTAAEKAARLEAEKTQAVMSLAGAGISLISLAITAGVSIWQKYKQAEEEAIKSVSENASKLDSTFDSIDDTATKVQQLREILDDSNSSYEDSVKAREELQKIQAQLRQSYGDEADDINVVTDSLDDYIKKFKELKKEQANDYIEENESNYNKAKNKINKKHQVEGDEIVGRYNTMGRSLLYMGLQNDYSVPSSYSGMRNAEKEYLYGTKMIIRNDNYDNLSKELTDAANYLKENREKIADLYDIKLSAIDDEIAKIEKKAKEYSEKNKDAKETVSAYEEKLLDAKGYELFKDELSELAEKEVLTKDNVEKLIKQYPELDDAMKKNSIKVKDLIKDYQRIPNVIGDNVNVINDSLKSFNDEKLTKKQILNLKDNKDASEELKKAYEDLKKVADDNGISLETLVDNLVRAGKIAPDVSEEIKTVAEATNNYNTELKALNTEIDNIQAGYNAVVTAQEEYNENGWISIDTLQSLLTLGWEYYDALVDENGQINLNSQAYEDMTNAKLDAMEAAALNLYYEKLLAIEHYGTAQATADEKILYEQLVDSWKNSQVTIDETIAKIQELHDTINSGNDETKKNLASQAEKEYKDTVALIKKTREGVGKNFKSAMGVGSKSSSSGSQKEWWETELDNLKNQFNYNNITIDQYINGLEGLLGKLDKGSEAWNKINQELQKQRLDKVKDDYNAGRISLSQYIKELEKLQKAYKEGTKGWNDLADAIKKAKLDELKEQQDDLKAALSAVNKELQNQIDNYEDLKDAAIDAIDKEIDKQEELKDSIDDNIDDYERAQQAVLKYLNEQLDSLNENKDSLENYFDTITESLENMNDEQERAVELAEAYENLVNAMSNKTKKVYKEGLGWVWEADQEAIKEARKTYEDLLKESQLKEIEDSKDKTLQTLDEQIEALENYITSWDEVLDKFENEKNKNLADLLLGENWSEAVSQLDPNIVEDFSNAYYNLQKSLEETEAEIERLNKQKDEEEEYWDNIIDKVKDYKDQWSEVANAYEEAANKQKANQLLAANWEQDILNQRLNVLEDFKNKYNRILSEIDLVNGMSTNAVSNYTPYSLPGYSNGGEVNFTGLAMLHGTPNKPEYVFNNDQIRNLLSNLTKPQYTSNINNNGSSVVNNYSIGNIELPNVQNSQQFINELKSLVNTSKNL